MCKGRAFAPTPQDQSAQSRQSKRLHCTSTHCMQQEGIAWSLLSSACFRSLSDLIRMTRVPAQRPGHPYSAQAR